MKKLIITAFILMSSLTTKAQEYVYHSGTPTYADAYRMVGAGYSAPTAIAHIETSGAWWIKSDGTINGAKLGHLDSVIVFLQNTKTKTSTNQYTITSGPFGSAVIIFAGSREELYLTSYARKEMLKSIKSYKK
jgi:hypothetical protein